MSQFSLTNWLVQIYKLHWKKKEQIQNKCNKCHNLSNSWQLLRYLYLRHLPGAPQLPKQKALFLCKMKLPQSLKIAHLNHRRKTGCCSGAGVKAFKTIPYLLHHQTVFASPKHIPLLLSWCPASYCLAFFWGFVIMTAWALCPYMHRDLHP